MLKISWFSHRHRASFPGPSTTTTSESQHRRQSEIPCLEIIFPLNLLWILSFLFYYPSNVHILYRRMTGTAIRAKIQRRALSSHLRVRSQFPSQHIYFSSRHTLVLIDICHRGYRLRYPTPQTQWSFETLAFAFSLTHQLSTCFTWSVSCIPPRRHGRHEKLGDKCAALAFYLNYIGILVSSPSFLVNGQVVW